MEQIKRPANIILNKPKTKLYCFQTIDSRKALDSRFRGNGNSSGMAILLCLFP